MVPIVKFRYKIYHHSTEDACAWTKHKVELSHGGERWLECNRDNYSTSTPTMEEQLSWITQTWHNNVVDSNEAISKHTRKHTESEGNIETCQNTMKTDVPFKKLSNPYIISLQRMGHLLRTYLVYCLLKSGTQVCTESEGHIETCQYTKNRHTTYSKSFIMLTQFQIVHNLCTACSDTHSLMLHTYTATYVHTYTPTQLHTYIPTQVHTYTAVVHEHRCTYMWMWMYVYLNVHWPMEVKHLLVARDVTLGHVGGLASEFSAYTCSVCPFQQPYSSHVG